MLALATRDVGEDGVIRAMAVGHLMYSIRDPDVAEVYVASESLPDVQDWFGAMSTRSASLREFRAGALPNNDG